MTGCSNMPTGCKEFISRFGKIVGSATRIFPDRTASPTHAWEACPAPVPYHRPMREATIPCLRQEWRWQWIQACLRRLEWSDQGFRTHAHLFGQLQLTAWRGPDHRNVTAIRTLVGCMEFLDGIDFVTEEFDRTGCGNVGGNTSIMPPRTANSPRSITKSTRVYAFSTSRCDASSSANSSPWENTSGSTSPKPATTG